MSLRATDATIFSLFKDRVFIVPMNQRKYIWEERNWAEWLDDILLVCNEKNRNHFIGSIVFKEEKPDNGIREHLSIIDGQQRIITTACLFASIGIKFALECEKGKVDAIKRHLIAKDNNSVSFPIVSSKANESVSELSKKIDEMDGTLESSDSFFDGLKIETKIKKCVLYFYNRIKELSVESIDALLDSIDSTRFVQIQAENDEDAYSIFEVLNARGQELSNFDLLRNYLLKYIDDANRDSARTILLSIEESLELNCDTFLRHYVIHRYKIGQEKKRKLVPYKIIVKNEKTNDKLLFLNDLNLKVQYYKKILKPDDCIGLEKKVFGFYKSRKQQQFRPLLLGLMHQYYGTKVLKKADYEASMEDLFRFYVCYNVIGDLTSNKIDDIVDKYSYLIENEFDNNTVKKMKESLSKRIPSFDFFSNKVASLRYSNKFKAHSGSIKENNIRSVLEIIEVLHNSSIDINSMKSTVEHCFPDSLSEENSKIGNLILLEPEINELLRDKPIDQKIPYYEKSVFETPKMIAREYRNGRTLDINKRASEIATEIFGYIKNY